MGLLTLPPYFKFQPEDYYPEALRLFHIRLSLERAACLERASRVGIGRATTPAMAAMIRRDYAMDEELDTTAFLDKKIKICITPSIDPQGNVTFSRYMKVGNKVVKDRSMESEIRIARSSMMRYLSGMREEYDICSGCARRAAARKR